MLQVMNARGLAAPDVEPFADWVWRSQRNMARGVYSPPSDQRRVSMIAHKQRDTQLAN